MKKARTTRMILAGLLLARSVSALDHRNLDAGLPLSVEDAYTIKYREPVLQGVGFYRNSEGSVDHGDLNVEFEYGIARDFQLDVGASFLAESPGKNEGNLETSLLYNFNTETLSTPAFAVKGEIAFPLGSETEDLEMSARVILTKTLVYDRIHLNAGSIFVDRDGSQEVRQFRWEAIVGWDRPVGLHSLIVLDFVVRQSEHGGNKALTILEAGLRKQITPRTVANFGVGTGFTGDSEQERFRAVIGLSRSF